MSPYDHDLNVMDISTELDWGLVWLPIPIKDI